MSKGKPFSKLKKQIESLFDSNLSMQFCCNSFPIRGQWGHKNSIPRYFVKIETQIIWDYPKDFEIKELHFGFWADNNSINELVREYIDTPLENLLNKEFEKENIEYPAQYFGEEIQDAIKVNYQLTNLFKAADRRFGKEKLYQWANTVHNPKVYDILNLRFGSMEDNNKLRVAKSLSEIASRTKKRVLTTK